MREKLICLVRLFDPKRFVKFGLIGVLNTLVDFVVFYSPKHLDIKIRRGG